MIRTHPRLCPVCQVPTPVTEVMPERLDGANLDAFAFASRKEPDAMNLRMVECRGCGVLFATPAPTPEDLANLYRSASFDTADAGDAAARTYAGLVDGIAGRMPGRDGALDIGTGTGSFLAELLARGWTNVRGVEPSEAPVAMARPEVRGLIIPEVFRDGMFGDERFRLVTCFQTMEHVPDPLALARSVRATLKPGGAFMVVVHDRRFWLNRVLGRRSPIMDIEHLQLFCPQSLTRLLRQAGYEGVEVRPVTNAYPLEYWVRLLPLPRPVKTLVQRVLGPCLKRMVRVSVGNLMGVGWV